MFTHRGIYSDDSVDDIKIYENSLRDRFLALSHLHNVGPSRNDWIVFVKPIGKYDFVHSQYHSGYDLSGNRINNV